MLITHRQTNGLPIGLVYLCEYLSIRGLETSNNGTLSKDPGNKKRIRITPVFSLNVVVGAAQSDIRVEALFHCTFLASCLRLKDFRPTPTF
jgi:hypothetical protein